MHCFPKKKVNSLPYHLYNLLLPHIQLTREPKWIAADPPGHAMLCSLYSSFCLFPLHSISTYRKPTHPSTPFFKNTTFIHSSGTQEEVPCCSPPAGVSPSQSSESTLQVAIISCSVLQLLVSLISGSSHTGLLQALMLYAPSPTCPLHMLFLLSRMFFSPLCDQLALLILTLS